MDEDDREMELDSVEAIFPELVRRGPCSVSLELPVSLSRPVSIAVAQVGPPPASLHDTLSFHQKDDVKTEVHHVWNLPPLDLNIDLPEGYPNAKAPDVKLKSQMDWLSSKKVSELEASAIALWEDMGRDMVIYSFVEQLQEAAEDCFGLAPEGILDLPPELTVSLLDHDAKVKKAKFDQETFDCGVCLEPKKGAVCHRMHGCGHVFCVQCLQDFYNNCITEGDVSSVKCMDFTCGKDPNDPKKKRRKPKKLKPSELLQIPIAEDAVQRYVKMRRKKKLESDPNTVYCPRQWCQGPARKGGQALSDDETDSETEDLPIREDLQAAPTSTSEAVDTEANSDDPAEKADKAVPPSERLAQCTECGYAFCFVCKKTWHGALGICTTRSINEITRDEHLTREYLKKFSSKCPTCSSPAQKTMGCNHMICPLCETHYCYLCTSWLDSGNPYRHFNTAGTPCYQRLWELEEGHRDEAGPRVAEAMPPRPRPQPPPPPRVIFEDDAGGQGQGDRRNAGGGHRQAGRVPPPAPAPPPQADHVRVNRRAQQGLVRAAPWQPNLPGHGLQRFLAMADRDEEDEWDSDELDDDFVAFNIR